MPGTRPRDATTSITMGLGSLFFDFLWKIPIVAIYTAVYELTPLRVPVLWWTIPLMLLGQDFFYYWSHRVPRHPHPVGLPRGAPLQP